MDIIKTITTELDEYLFGSQSINEDMDFSEYRLKKRISYFKNRHYTTGKVTEEGDYEFWFDIIHPCVNDEIKNIDFDTKHILVFSKSPVEDFAATYISNLVLDEFMWEQGVAEDINSFVEDFSADGNILWRKTNKGYETCDMLNTFIINQTAKTIEDTPIIERFYLTQTGLRKMKGVYDSDVVDEVIKEGGNKFYSRTELSFDEITTFPLFEIYRRTGEVSEYVLFKAQNKSQEGSKDKFVLATIIVAGLKKDEKGKGKILFAEEIKSGKMSDVYIEAHRGPYKGRWWREGMYELLFDLQVRYNDISNQIARGLEYASKVLFRHTDVMTLQNVRTALDNGSLIKSENIQQIEVRLQGFDQLVNDRNNIIQLAQRIANSSEVVQGGSLPASTPYRLGLLMDVNSGKLYALLRQKLTVPFKRVIREDVLKKLVMNTKGKDIIRVSGNASMLENFYNLAVNNWYVNNLAEIGPHTPEVAEQLKLTKLEELRSSDPMIENSREIWESVFPRLQITITGENLAIEAQETVINMLQFETDPIRRAYLMDLIYSEKGINVPPPVSEMEQVQQTQSGGNQQNKNSFNVKPEEVATPTETVV